MKANRGAVILPVLVIVGVISVLTYALLLRSNAADSLQGHQRLEREGALAEMSAKAAAQAAMMLAARTGDFSNVQQQILSVLREVPLEEWTSSRFTVIGPSPSELFLKTSALEIFTDQSPTDGLSGFALAAVHEMECEFVLGASLQGSEFSRAGILRARLFEFSGAEFQIITTSEPFDSDRSAAIELNGKALLAAGFIRSGANAFQSSANSRILTYGQAALNETGLQVYRTPQPTWGVADTAHLIGDHSYSLSAIRQNLSRHISNDLPNTSVLEWSDVSTPPQGLPQGITLQEIGGKTRLTVNLTYWFQQGAVIRCTSEETAEAGVAVVGNTGSGNQIPAAIVTNGRVTLVGSNARPALVASNSAHSPILLSDEYDGTLRPAAHMVWRGRLVFPVEDLSFDTSREDWSSAHLEVIGGILFKGGRLVGVPRVALYSDPIVRAAFSGYPIGSERVLFTHVSMPN